MRVHFLVLISSRIYYSEKRREEKKRKDLMCAAATYHAHPCNKSCVGIIYVSGKL